MIKAANSRFIVRKTIKTTILVLCAVIFIMGVFLANRMFIVIMTMAMSVTVATVTLFHNHLFLFLKRIRQNRIGRIVVYTTSACIFLTVLYTIVISLFMLSAMSGNPPDDATIIILGARVAGDEPSQILYRRMETALQFLHDNPKSVAIPSGGLGSEANISEAEAMRRFFVNGGISENRVFTEDSSTSTRENVVFSSIIIHRHDLSKNVAIVTDGFHQFRAQNFAKDAGLSPSALPSVTPIHLLPFYWLREIVAITTQVIFR